MANRAAEIRAENAGKAVTGRGRNWIDLDNSRRVFSIDPIHYGLGADQEIDTAWQPDVGAWQWKLEDNNFQIHARDFLNAGNIVEWLDTRSGESVTIQPLAFNWVDNVTDSRQQIALPQAVQATANDETLLWSDGYGTGRHFRYEAHSRRLRKYFIVDSPGLLPAPTVANPYLEVEFIIDPSSGLSLFVDGQEWNKSTKTSTANRIAFRVGEIDVWYFDAPYAQDAVGNSIAGIFQLRKQGANLYCTVRIPKTWVDGATFPIEIDPTFTDGYGGDVDTAKDTMVKKDSADNNAGASVNLNCYNDGSAYDTKILMAFDLSSLGGSDTCNTADLHIFVGTSPTANATLYIYSIASGNTGWVEGTKAGIDGAPADTGESTWNNKNHSSTAWAGSAGLSTSGTDYDSTSIGSFSVANGDSIGTEDTVSLTASVVEGWFGTSNDGILIKETGTQSYSSLRMASSDNATTSYRPYLVVDYTSGAATLSVDIGPVNNSVQGVKVVG